MLSRTVYDSPLWRRVRHLALVRDQYLCQVRGPTCTRDATTVDHIIPIDEGGEPYDLTNLRSACDPCNYGRPSRRRALRSTAVTTRTPSRSW